MATDVSLPRLGQGMEAGTIVRWLKSEGDTVEKGEPLYELDTDKVTQEVEADVGGVLLKILISEGEVPVGTPVAFLGEAGEQVPAISAEAEMASPEPEPQHQSHAPQESEQAAEPVQTASRQSTGGRVKASPLARRIARERGIDLSAVAGTGPEGRIVAEDVERAQAGAASPLAPVAAPVPTGEVERRELTSVRKTIARRLTEAWQIPVFQLQTFVDMTRANALVASLREAGTKATVTDVLTKVCGEALL